MHSIGQRNGLYEQNSRLNSEIDKTLLLVSLLDYVVYETGWN